LSQRIIIVGENNLSWVSTTTIADSDGDHLCGFRNIKNEIHPHSRSKQQNQAKSSSFGAIMIIRLVRIVLVVSFLIKQSSAWIPSLPNNRRSSLIVGPLTLSSSAASSSNDSIVAPTTTTTATATAASPASRRPDTTQVEDEDDDDEEYEYIEYDNLTEKEFVGSEWLVGTCWDNRNNIQETWCRLIVDTDGKNVAIWGDNSQGSWNLDVASQFISWSKENKLLGKQIWAATVDDYYYLQGTVRGWRFWSAAAVLGQWQARRLGVDKDEAGIAPWFADDDDVDGDDGNDGNDDVVVDKETESPLG
jgi:hypothetical protein